MPLFLDGGFWGPWIERSYPAEIESLREALMTRVLPALPDPDREADAESQRQWAAAMSQPSDGSDDTARWAEWVVEQRIERYERARGVQQAILNMGTVMLWHLLEQQMLSFHRRQVLSKQEECAAMNEPKQHKRFCTLKEFENRMKTGGYALCQLRDWPKLKELKLVANTVKHGAGESARALYSLRQDLFSPPSFEGTSGTFLAGPESIERPASGNDLYVTKRDLNGYFDAAKAFWSEFARLVKGQF